MKPDFAETQKVIRVFVPGDGACAAPPYVAWVRSSNAFLRGRVLPLGRTSLVAARLVAARLVAARLVAAHLVAARLVAAQLVAALLLGCAAQPAPERPFRSPTRDYPAPPAQTSDGEVVGADRMAPGDKLQQGPTNDRAAPGWSLEDGKPDYNPKDQVGGHTDHTPGKPELKHDHDKDGVEDH